MTRQKDALRTQTDLCGRESRKRDPPFFLLDVRMALVRETVDPPFDADVTFVILPFVLATDHECGMLRAVFKRLARAGQ